jgi:precorrin-6A/cobalt-precorrin-6A reductase
VVDPPEVPVPERWTLITARGPYHYPAERRLMAEFGVGVLLTKDSGGSHTVAKVEAAGDLGIPIVIIARPGREPATQVSTVADALDWLSGVPVAPGA